MADNNHRVSWTVLMGDGLLLLCALLGFSSSFLSLYGGYGLPGATALARCAANGDLFLAYAVLFGLATLVVWSLPRYWSAAAGILTALWAGSVLWNRTEVAQGACITVHDITVLFASRVEWGQTFPYETGLLPVQEAAAVKLFLLLTLAGLALLLGWAVVRSRRWWVVLSLTLPPLLPGLLADLYPDWLSFMALAACWCAMLLTSLCRWAAASGRGRLTLTVFPTVALVLALITALFPRDGYTRPAWARKAENDLRNLTSHLSDYFPNWNNSPFKSTATYVGAAGEADLAHAGPLSYTGRIVLRVTTDYDGRLYLRGSSLAVYENGVWKALPGGTYEAYRSEHEFGISPLYLPAMQGQDGHQIYTATVDNVGAVGTCVYTPYFLLPQDVDETGMMPVEDAYFARRQGQWSHTMTFVQSPPNLSITVDVSGKTTVWFTGDTYSAQSAASAYAKYVYEHYLDVPEDMRETLERHGSSASIVTSYVPPFVGVLMAEQLGSYLDTLCEYDAGAPAAPEGVDPVYYFLNVSHRGYCMHYASAVTLMLRAAGIPARYVSGFSAEVVPDQQTRIPDRAAHAWVEVWVDGFGWYPVEVTPADAFAWAQSGAQNTDDPDVDTPKPTLAPTAAPGPTGTPDQPTASLPGGEDNVDGPGKGESGPDFSVLFNLLKGAVPVIGVFLLIWFVQYAVKRFRARRMAGADANRSALLCYSYLCRLERWGGKLDEQAVELAQKARFSQHTLSQEELSVLRGLVDRERTRLCMASGLPKRLMWRYWWGMPKAPVPLADSTPPKQEK